MWQYALLLEGHVFLFCNVSIIYTFLLLIKQNNSPTFELFFTVIVRFLKKLL